MADSDRRALSRTAPRCVSASCGPARRPRALSQFGSFYELPPIASQDWTLGIPSRLKLDHCTIDEDALGTKLYQGLAPDVASQTLRALRDAGIIEHHGRGEWRIFDPLLRRYLQQVPGEGRHA